MPICFWTAEYTRSGTVKPFSSRVSCTCSLQLEEEGGRKGVLCIYMAWQPTKSCPSWAWASTTTTTTTTDSSDGAAATTAMVLLQNTLNADLKKKDGNAWAVDDLMQQNARNTDDHDGFCHGGGSSSILGVNLSSLVPPSGCKASSGSSTACNGLLSFLDYSRPSPLLFNGSGTSKAYPYAAPDCRLGTAAIETCKHGMVDCKLCVADGKQYSGIKTGSSGFLELSSSSSLAQWKPIHDKRASTSQGQLFLPCAGGTHQDTSGTQSTDEQYSSTGTGSAGSGDSLTGLHLGKRNDASGMATAGTLKPPLLNNPATPPSKKQRTSSANLQTPRCQVYGCNIELTTAKAYHRRHKVCDAHSKSEKVVVANLEQRFCQQCSRFHVLAEFDEVKRSCRKRLAGHNERRRKPHPDSLSLNARFSSIFQEWPFFHRSKLMGLPSSLFRDPMDSRSVSSKEPWQKWEDPKSHSWDLMQSSSGVEKELFLTGFSAPPPHFTQKLSPLLLLQSPTGMMSRMPTNDSPSERCLQYVARSFSDLGNGLTLSSSSERGVGTLSGLEVTPPPPPLPPAVARVADSGCALSLLSAGSHASDAVSLDLSTRTTSLLLDSLMHENHVSIPHDLALNNYSITTDNLMTMGFNSQKDPSVSNRVGDEQYVSSLVHNGYNGNGDTGCFQSLPLFSSSRQLEHMSKVHHDQAPRRPPAELMQIMPLSHYAHQPHEQSVSFQLGGNPFGDLHYSDESSFIDLQQRI